MYKQEQFTECMIDKSHLSAMAIFAINNVPHTDKFTLNKFLEVINTTGSFGSLSLDQIVTIMQWMIKNLPNVKKRSFLTLIELLSAWMSVEVKSNEEFVINWQQRGNLLPGVEKEDSS